MCGFCYFLCFFFFNDTATTEIYTLSLHDALPISNGDGFGDAVEGNVISGNRGLRSEEHTSELQSLRHLVCRLLLEKKKKAKQKHLHRKQKKKQTNKHQNNQKH